jgi:hypothetical protein
VGLGGWLGEMEGRGGAAEVPVLGDDREVPYQAQIQVNRSVGHNRTVQRYCHRPTADT